MLEHHNICVTSTGNAQGEWETEVVGGRGVVCGREEWCVGGRSGGWEGGVVGGRKEWCVGGRSGVWEGGVVCGAALSIHLPSLYIHGPGTISF